MDMETAQLTGQEVPLYVVEGALEVFGDGSEFAELPVLAFVPLVNESDWYESTGLLEQVKEFARDTLRAWTGNKHNPKKQTTVM